MNKYISNIIIACDFESKKQLELFIKKFKGKKLFLKFGLQILLSEGFEIIKEYKKMGHNIFVDLKLHDIPNTVKGAIESLLKYKPDFITIHAQGGMNMLEAASKTLESKSTKAIAVTLLTSLDDDQLRKMNVSDSLEKIVNDLMNITSKAKIDYVVCSPSEVKIAKKYKLKTITPGIRFDLVDDDQKRFSTPKEAFINGANFIVIGRPLTQSSDPLAIYNKIEKGEL